MSEAMTREQFARFLYDHTTAGGSPQKVIDEYGERLAEIERLKRACRAVEKQMQEVVESFEAGAAAWRANAVKLTKERDDALETLEATTSPLINAADVLGVISRLDNANQEVRAVCAKWEKECREAHAAVMALKSDADLTPEEHMEGARVREMLLKTAQDEIAKKTAATGPTDSFVFLDAERAPPVPTLNEVRRHLHAQTVPIGTPPSVTLTREQYEQLTGRPEPILRRSAPTCFTCMRPMVSAGMRTRGPDAERPPWELFKCDRHEAASVLLDTDPLDTMPMRKDAYQKGWRECVGFVRMSRDTFREGTASRAACETVLADLEKAATLPIGEERDDP